MEGINIAGFLTAESGLGTAVRSTVAALKSAGVPYALTDIACTSSRREDMTFADAITNTAPYATSLFHVQPDVAAKAAKEVPEEFWNASMCIAYWVWESSVVPADFALWSRKFDAVWTPSSYSQKILSEALSIPVHCVPHAITSIQNDHPRDAKTFLCMFDYLSVFERKNPLGAIAAFQQAFSDSDAQLIIKCINSDRFVREHQQLLEAVCDDDRIQIIDAYMSAEDIHQLIGTCTALISLHRSEGFGLHLAEAMALHTPVIATNFGGNTDFMNTHNSALVECTLQPLSANIGPYPRGSLWAEPNIDHAAKLLQSVYKDDNSIRSELPEEFSVSSVGMQIGKLIEKISGA